TYKDEQAGLQVETAEVSVAKGLVSFLLDRGDLGTVTVVRPDILLLNEFDYDAGGRALPRPPGGARR
ncbi:MAG: hypothetical protein ACU85V_21105, partial [Gammaproteobacteria bacterium]